LAVYVFINLTSVLWLGSLAINTLTGLETFYGLVLLALLSLAYSLWGGLKAVALTDIIQVVLLIFGGLAVSFIALQKNWRWLYWKWLNYCLSSCSRQI
jgi:SSS family solute:Na+ symporter